MKNIQIINAINAICKLEEIKSNDEKRYPKKVSFLIRRNKKKLIEVYKVYDEELKEIIKQHNLKDLSAETIKELPVEKQEKLFKEINELQTVDVDIALEKINEEDFGEYDPNFEELDLLDFMIS